MNDAPIAQRKNILRAHVDWNLDYANCPDLRIEVAQLPDWSAFRFKAKELINGNTLYWAEHEGFVRYFCHDHRNSEGFGGRVFDIVMHDGEERHIKGPWSSRAGVLNAYFPPCVDVTVYDRSHFSGTATAMTLELATYAAHLAGTHLIRVPSENEWNDKDWEAFRVMEIMGVEMTVELPSLDMGPHWAIPGKFMACIEGRYHYIVMSSQRIW